MPDFLDEWDEIDDNKNEEKEKIDEKDVIDQKPPEEDDEFITMDVGESSLEGVPKTLYDSICALQSTDRCRIAAALKHLPYLIRASLPDLCVYGEQLTTLMLKVHEMFSK